MVVIVLIFYYLPKSGKFKFEYKEKGPWQHEDLISPFQFSIIKAQAEIDAEKREIIKNFKPLFKKDLNIVRHVIPEFIKPMDNLKLGDL